MGGAAAAAAAARKGPLCVSHQSIQEAHGEDSSEEKGERGSEAEIGVEGVRAEGEERERERREREKKGRRPIRSPFIREGKRMGLGTGPSETRVSGLVRAGARTPTPHLIGSAYEFIIVVAGRGAWNQRV